MNIISALPIHSISVKDYTAIYVWERDIGIYEFLTEICKSYVSNHHRFANSPYLQAASPTRRNKTYADGIMLEYKVDNTIMLHGGSHLKTELTIDLCEFSLRQKIVDTCAIAYVGWAVVQMARNTHL